MSETNGERVRRPIPEGAYINPNGGWILPVRKGDPPHPGSLARRGGTISQWTRRDVRRMLVQEVAASMDSLREWISGRAKVLVGFKNYEELAERFHEVYERRCDPDADRVAPWAELSQARRDLLIECMREITGGKLTLRMIALNIGFAGQQQALELAMRYGLGTQLAPVDDEGNTLPGVVMLPKEDIYDAVAVQARQLKAIAAGEQRAAEAEDAEYEFVVEEVSTLDHKPGEDEPPPEMRLDERVNPAMVQLVKQRYQPENGEE